MINFKNVIIGSMTLLLFITMYSFNFTQDKTIETDKKLVYAAVEDYVLALYEVKPERIERSVDTTLRKIGYYDYKGESYYNTLMTYQQLYDLSATWNKDGDRANDESPKEIEIYEVYDKTASARLIAEWGIDFMHLYKNNQGKWKIMNVMWQSEPK